MRHQADRDRFSPGQDMNRMIGEIERILGFGMGARIFPMTPSRQRMTPHILLLLWVFAYSLALAVAVPASVPLDQIESHGKLISVLLWGGFYFGGAAFAARATTLRIMEAVKDEVIPFASAAYASQVARELRRLNPRWLQHGIPLLTAMLFMGVTIWMMDQELGAGKGGAPWSSPDMLLWYATFFLFYFAAAQSVVACRFYLAFANNLERRDAGTFDRFRFDPFIRDATASPLIRGISHIATLVLEFWMTIFGLVISILLLAIIPPEAFRLSGTSPLLFLIIPVASFFSLGVGTIVYFLHERRIRAVLQRVTMIKAIPIQQRINDMIDNADPAQKDAVAALKSWHDDILAGGRYGNRLGAGLSLALPFILPVLTIMKSVFDR